MTSYLSADDIREFGPMMTRRQLARAIARRNRRLAVEARRLAREYMGAWAAELTPVERARELRRLARALVAGDSAWALVWIRRARSWPDEPAGAIVGAEPWR